MAKYSGHSFRHRFDILQLYLTHPVGRLEANVTWNPLLLYTLCYQSSLQYQARVAKEPFVK